MKKLTVLTILALLATWQPAAGDLAYAAAQKAVYMAPLTWRADGAGRYAFDDTIGLNYASIAKDGSVATDSSQGTAEPQSAYATDGLITNVTLNWQFTGIVTMEVTITGKDKDYTAVTNGVPLDCSKMTPGRSLKWRATLAPQSSLTEVRITYKDASGVMGSFGNADLSGFTKRIPIVIANPSSSLRSTEGAEAISSLFNYQIQMKVGESAKAAGCDAYLRSPSQSDMLDIRFTQPDGETGLPYYMESLTGTKPNRVAAFWIKVPEIPKAGLPIYMYYGKAKADDLSNGEKVFDFFDDFNGAKLDANKWKIALETKASQVAAAGSMLSIDAARVTTTGYNFGNGIIEYRAKMSDTGGIAGIIAAGPTADDDLTAYSSITAASANCIELGGKALANSPQQIALDTFYDFRIISDDGNITFQRYADGWADTPQSETKVVIASPAKQGEAISSPIGLSAGPGGNGLVCDYIRTRKFTAAPPHVDINATAAGKEEAMDLPKFDNLTLAPDGSVTLSRNAASGDYTSSLIPAGFQVRMITPSWNSSSLRGGAEGADEAISVSTDNGATFVPGWQNGIAKYASKKEFVKGNQLRWQARFAVSGSRLAQTDNRTPNTDNRTPSLNQFSLTYQPGTITIVAPNGGENIMPGSQYNIIWNTTGYDTAYSMDLSYSDDGGTTFQSIAKKTANAGNYAWAVPQDDSILVSVKVSDSFDNTVFGVSSNYFTISAESAAQPASSSVIATTTKSDEAIPKPDDSKTPPPAGLYELLIKKADVIARSGATKQSNVSSVTGYQPGDVVMIKPAGYLWGAEEKSKFIIIQAYLSQDEVKKLMLPKTAPNGAITGRRRYMIDMKKKNVKDKVDLLKGAIRGKPLLERSEIEEKS